MISKIQTYAALHLNRKTLRTWILVLFIFILIGGILRDSVQGEENSLLMLMIASGLAAGWLLTTFTNSNWIAAITALLAGSILVTIRVGRLGNLLIALLKEGILYLTQIFQSGQNPNPHTIQMGLIELGDSLYTIGNRLVIWATDFIQGTPLFDPVAIALIWGFLFWIAAVWAMWFVFRYHKPLVGILPALTIISISLVYIGKPALTLIPILGLSVGLIVIVKHDAREGLWEEEKISYAGIIREKISTTAFVLAFGLMLFSAINPSFSIRSIVDFINRFTEEKINDDDIARSLGIENPADQMFLDILSQLQLGGLPNRHLIGSKPELGNQVVMTIQVEELGTPDPEEGLEDIPLYYWRNLTYDLYIGRGWASSDSVEQEYKAGEKTLTKWPESYRIIRQKVELVDDFDGLIFTAGIPLSVDQNFSVAWRIHDSEQEVYDIFGSLAEEKNYSADSLLPSGSTSELRAAGQEYTDWIIDNYLGLPESVPERVLALARDLTATEPTPYDRAVAIEQYLRKFPYTLDLPQPPLDRDIVDYFLFSAQRGYCDYYATAMVVLARAAGLPARLVTGYIGGKYDTTQEAYIITADLAHAWAEVYFPEYGWTIFEATGGRLAIDRPNDPIPKLSQDYAASYDPLVPQKERQMLKWFLIFGSSLLLAFLLGFIGWTLSDMSIKRDPANKLLPKLFKRIFRFARRAGIISKPGDTTYEFSEILVHTLKQYGTGSKKADWLLDIQPQLAELTEAYYEVLFSPQEGKLIQSRQIVEIFQNIRPRLWYLGLLIRSHPNRILRFLLWDSAPTFITYPSRKSR
ncbi:MAG: hypothetical protein MUO54_06565 [Anaerolineales bacterium]|nr:hypothetical protein [Anaerolineales bacterium]